MKKNIYPKKYDKLVIIDAKMIGIFAVAVCAILGSSFLLNHPQLLAFLNN